MNKSPLISLTLGAVLALVSGCNSGPNTQRGAVGGAAAGAVIGGIIGHQSGETGAGAALGAAAGAAAGGAYGNSKDKRVADNQTRDSYGYSNDDYYKLLTPQEKDTLKVRANGRNDMALVNYLSEDERANLRRRATGNSQIGR